MAYMDDNLDDELVFSTRYLDEILTEEENKVKGLKKGASAIILGLIAIVLAQNPIYINALPKALVLLKTLVIPESLILVTILGLISFVLSLLGFFYSIKKFNFRGLFLSVFMLFSFVGLGFKGYDLNRAYSNMVTEKNISKIITIEDRNKYIK